MMRALSLALFLLPSAGFAISTSSAAPAVPQAITGVVADPSGAIVPNAEIELVDSTGAVAGSFHSGGDGSFQIAAPHPGNFTLVVSEPGFDTVKTPVVVAAPVKASSAASRQFATLRIVLPIAALATNVHVNADTSEDISSTDDNHDA